MDNQATTNDRRSRRRPSPGFVVGVIALCFAIMGTAVAAGLAPNSVGSKQIKDGKVKERDLSDSGVTSAKLADGSVTSAKIADFEVSNQDLKAGNTVTTDKIGDETIASQDIGQDAIGNSELALAVRTGSVNVANNATGTVTAPCQAGEAVISGGGGFAGVPAGTTLGTSEAAGGGWHVEGQNKSGATQTLLVQAFCLRQ